MADKLDELKKLSPAARIKKLKEIQEKNKKEIEEAQAMIKKSQQEEEIEKELEQMPIPQLKSVDIDDLFSQEEKQLFKERRFVSEKRKPEEEPAPKKQELEQIAEQAPELNKEQEKANVEYAMQLSKKPAHELKERASEIYNNAKESGYMSHSQEEELKNIDYATRQKMKDIEQRNYSNVSKQVAEEMVATEKMKNWLQNMYKA